MLPAYAVHNLPHSFGWMYRLVRHVELISTPVTILSIFHSATFEGRNARLSLNRSLASGYHESIYDTGRNQPE
jgi:hypothetical protein